MKDISFSKKVGESYEKMGGIKNGEKGLQLGLSPAFKKQILAWLKDPSESWFNINLKEWDNGGQQAQGTAAVSTAPKTAGEIDDSIPF